MGHGVVISAFGHFSVRVAGRERTSALSPRVRRCLAHLALRETAADRPELAAALWPDAAARDALGNLRRRLHDLSGALHAVGLADAVEVTRDRVALSAHARWAIDVVRYSILARDPSQAARAAALYREPIFPGLDDEVLEQARRRLHGAQIELLTRLLDAAIGRRDAPAIAELAEAIERLDPLSERTAAKAVEALEAQGESDRARRLYERLSAHLREELGEGVAPFQFIEGPPEVWDEEVLQGLARRGDELRGAAASRHFEDLERRYSSIRAALDAAITRGAEVELGTRAAIALSRFLFERGHAVDAVSWFESAIGRLTRSPLRAEALYLRALVGRNLGNADHGLPAFEEAIAELREVGDATTLAKALLYASNAARMTARVPLAMGLANEALAILKGNGDAYLIAFARSAIGAAAYALGRVEEAAGEFGRARAGFAQAGAGDDECLMIVNVGRCALAAGDLVAASENLSRACDLAAMAGNVYVSGHAEVGLTLTSLESGELDSARIHAARAADLAAKGSDLEIAVIAVEAAGELFLALGEHLRARDAIAAADGVRAEYLITRSPTEHARAQRIRDELAVLGQKTGAAIAAPDIMMRSLLQSVARSYRGPHTL
ncbi:MAG TPA: bacterial transcriptional activator domain-containing protein [Candidatus Cybelea sp.]